MTDNSDWMARFLPPENTERREPAAPAPVGTEAVSIPDPRIPDPGPPPRPRMDPPQFWPRTPPFEAAPPGPGRGVDEGAHARQLRPPPGIGERPDAAPSHADDWAAPRAAPTHDTTFRPNGGPVSQPPAPIPPAPQLDQPADLPPPWRPSEDPDQRWAPRADPRPAGTWAPERHVQVTEVVKKRRPPATLGWRKAVYTCTGTLVNLGAGPHERTLRDWTTLIKSNIPRTYQIAAVSVKGGVGKTRLTACVGTLLAQVRGEPVIAIDADTTYGGLGRFVDPTETSTLREYLADQHAGSAYPMTRQYTGKNDQGLEVLASHQNVASEFQFDKAALFATLGRTRRIYQLCLVDSAQMETEVFKSVLSTSDALMIVGSCNAAGLLAVETSVEWLAARRGHELLKRSVIVLNDSGHCANKKFISHVTETVGKRVRAVKLVPWDAHLRDADALDFPALRTRTQLALMELAAELAGGFATAGALSG